MPSSNRLCSWRFYFLEIEMNKPFDHAPSARTSQARPLLVEIIAYAPTAFYHCTHCEVAWREMGASNRIHQEQMVNSLPEDLIKEYQVVSDWVKEIFRTHGDQIMVKVIDAASIEGFYKSLKYNARRYPAVILNGGTARFIGSQMLSAASEEFARQLSNQRVEA
jgi:hypothetical protein